MIRRLTNECIIEEGPLGVIRFEYWEVFFEALESIHNIVVRKAIRQSAWRVHEWHLGQLNRFEEALDIEYGLRPGPGA